MSNLEGKEIPREARGPEVRQIRYENAWDGQEERNQILEHVLAFAKENGLDPDNILVRGFEGTPEKMDEMLATGIEHQGAELWAVPAKNIAHSDEEMHDPEEASPVTYADTFTQPALALYDRAKLERGSNRENDPLGPYDSGSAKQALLAVMKMPGSDDSVR